jgi:hypothetical protein
LITEQGQAAGTFGSQIKDAVQNKRVFRVIIENEQTKAK